MATGGPEEFEALEDTASMPPDSRPTNVEPDSHRRIGSYRLLHVIGEGGMGEVWVADQLEPVKRSPDYATGVDEGAEFSWTPIEAGITVLHAFDPHSEIWLITAKTTAHFPDLCAHGFIVPPSSSFMAWRRTPIRRRRATVTGPLLLGAMRGARRRLSGSPGCGERRSSQSFRSSVTRSS